MNKRNFCTHTHTHTHTHLYIFIIKDDKDLELNFFINLFLFMREISQMVKDEGWLIIVQNL